MARAVVSRLLHDPTLRLKDSAGENDSYRYVHALRELFGARARRARSRGRSRRGPRSRRSRRAAARAPGDPAGHARQRARAGAGRARGRAARRRGRARPDHHHAATGGRGPAARGQVALREGDRGGAAGRRDRPGGALGQGRARRAARGPGDRGRAGARRPARRALRRGRDRRPCPEGATVGTGSLRRRSQLLALRPDLEVRDLRGNVDTRLRRLADGDYDAIVLAAAGLERLGRSGEGSPVAAGRAAARAPARAAWRSRRARTTRGSARRPAAITDRDALTALLAERARGGRARRRLPHPDGRARPGRRRADSSCAAYVGLPDGSHWIRDALEDDAAEPAARGRAPWPSGCWAPAPPSCWRQAERASAPLAFRSWPRAPCIWSARAPVIRGCSRAARSS